MISWTELEDKIYKQQEDWIVEHYGDAQKANYGWFVDEREGATSVHTKVYGLGVLISTGDRRGSIVHEFVGRNDESQAR